MGVPAGELGDEWGRFTWFTRSSFGTLEDLLDKSWVRFRVVGGSSYHKIFVSGFALFGKMLLVRIIENNKIDVNSSAG